MAGAGQPDEVVRPFQCPQCGSRYTRQEHLSRHQQARHSDVKEFVCNICGKGFARRDILRRHEQGHAKKAEAEEAKQTKPKGKKTSAASRKRESDIEMMGESPPPTKTARTSKACFRCSKSKLRCDGELPCGRCRKMNAECSFDRDNDLSMLDDTQGQSPSAQSEDGSPSMIGDSPEDEYADLHSQPPQLMGGWNQQALPPLPNMSPYSVPIRPSPLHPQHALPPASFHHQQPPSVGSPGGHYYARPPDAFHHGYRAQSPYGGSSAAFAAQQSAAAAAAMYNAHPLPTLPGQPHRTSSPAQPLIKSQWDTAAFGRASTSAGGAGHGPGDFLDLIANNASSNESSDIDWALLQSGYTPRSEGFTPNDGIDGQDGSNVHAHNFLPMSGLNSPAPNEIEASLLNSTNGGGGSTIQQQSSSLRQSLAADDLATGSSGDGETEGVSDPMEMFPASGTLTPLLQQQHQHQQQSNEAPVSSATSLAHESASSLSIQGSAAETLLQLASHTPRGSPEPEHRTSHPIHNLADPWPLSYRPTEKTERLDKGASRAASPRPGASGLGSGQHTMEHVPAVTATTRARVLDKVREIGEQDRFVPRVELLDLFVQLYFDRFAGTLATLHRPTFDPNTCPSFLLLAVASVGARYAYDRVAGAKMHAQALLEIARKMTTAVGDADNTLMRTVAWQQALIIVLFTGLAIGNKRSLELTQAHSSMPVTFARRQGWFRERQVDEWHERSHSLEERWKRWRDREEIKRLGFAALVFDSMGTALWNHDTSSLYLDAAKTSLPCHDSLWEAPSAIAWQALFGGSHLPERNLETLTAVTQLTDRAHHASEPLLRIARDGFSTTVLMCILHCLGWSKMHEKTITGLFLPAAAQFERGFEPVQAALDAGLEFFQDRVVLPAEMQAAFPGLDSTPLSTVPLMMHLTAITQRLPLRVLQPLARTGEWAASSEILDAVHAWAGDGNGTTARWTAYHAGQLFALVRQPAETPLEPFALFYATLAVLAYIRELNTPASAGMANGAIKTEPSSSSAQPTKFRLDRLVDRTDSELTAWIYGSPALSSALLEEPIGDLASPGAGIRLLRVAAKQLIALRVWRVGELLGRTLTELANEEERKAGGQYGATLGSGQASGSGAGGVAGAVDKQSANKPHSNNEFMV